MNKFKTGDYYIKIYDKYGTKQAEEFNIESLVEAKALASHLAQGGGESFVISRTLVNSLDDLSKF